MKYFKITRTWSVRADDEAEAIRLIEADPARYLGSEAVTRTEYTKSRSETGWGATLRSQFSGSNSKR